MSFSPFASLEAALTGTLDGGHRVLELSAGPYRSGELHAIAFQGREEISGLYSIDIELAGPNDDLFLRTLEPAILGKSAVLRLDGLGNLPRFFHGIITSFELLGRIGSLDNGDAFERSHLRVRLQPKLWQLTLKRNSRIFQRITVKDIVSTILDEWGIEFSWDVQRTLVPREYCTQYRETDYEFITRILSEEGCFFFFRAPPELIDDMLAPVAGVAGAAEMVGDLVGGEVGEAVSEVAEMVLPSEVLVIADDASSYLPTPDGQPGTIGVSVGGMASIAGAAGISAGGALSVATTVAGAVGLGGAMGPVLEITPSAALDGEDYHLRTFSLRRSMKPKAVLLGDYDFRRPNLNLHYQASLGDSATGGAQVDASLGLQASVFLSPKGLNLNASLSPTLNVDLPSTLEPHRYRVYEHHDLGEHESSPDTVTEINTGTAKRLLEQRRAAALQGLGVGTCGRLSPGHTFRLQGHPVERVNRDYVVTAVEHRCHLLGVGEAQAGQPARVYLNEFVCVPRNVPCRMEPIARTMRQVTETATVVGKSDEEVWTDSFGRIKVHFHWDLDGQKSEYSSCWIRAMQPWAAAGYGFQFIPRVGSEVVVTFLGGDPDRPVVTGCLYNGINPPSNLLPTDVLRSGIRTQSIPKGDDVRSNELAFYDGRDAELVYLHAQRDLHVEVGNLQTVSVGTNSRLVVGGAHREEVVLDRSEQVGGNRSVSVTGSHTETVLVNQSSTVGGNRTEIVKGPALLLVKGMQIHDSASHDVTVDGHMSTGVGTAEKEASWSLNVYGAEVHQATGPIMIRSDKQVVISCGDTQLVMDPEGVQIRSKKITLSASDTFLATGNGPGLQLNTEADLCADTIKLYSKGGSVELDSNAAHMDGPKVKLNCGAGSASISTQGVKPKTKPFKWKMLDVNMEPYKNKTYTLLTQGFKVKGTTDADGVIKQDIPEEAITANITLWTDDYPTGQRIVYSIYLGELPPSSSVYGAQIRLKNLGYYFGEESDQLSPELATAIRAFQIDFQLEPTGELDGATAGKLDEVHPTS